MRDHKKKNFGRCLDIDGQAAKKKEANFCFKLIRLKFKLLKSKNSSQHQETPLSFTLGTNPHKESKVHALAIQTMCYITDYTLV